MRFLVAPVSLILMLAAGPLARAETHAALGSRVELHLPLNPRYPGTDGAQTLVDGETGPVGISRQFLGFEGPDVEVTVHLPVETTVRTVAVDFLHQPTPAIFRPVSVDFAFSINGTNFATLATVLPKTPEREMARTLERIEVSGLDLMNVRAIRIRAANGGRVPSWHRAPQALRWIFISEILVNPGETPRSPVDLLQTYCFGESRWALTSLEKALRAGSPEERRKLCDDLGNLLSDAEATADAKRFALQQLAAFGGEGDVPAVAALIDNVELRVAVSRTLASIGGQAAEETLLTIAEKGEAGSADALAALGSLRSPHVISVARSQVGNEALRSVALAALREQGTVAAADALLEVLASAADTWRNDAAGCLVGCGMRLLAAGDIQQASRVFEAVWRSGCAAGVRAGALAGLVRAGKHELVPELLALTHHGEANVRRAALSLTAGMVDELGVQPISEGFASLPLSAKAVIIKAVGGSGRKAEAAWLRECHVGEDPVVRAATFQALGKLGDASDVAVLVTGMSDDAADVAKAASDALCRLSDAGVDAALLEVASGIDGNAREALCKVFVSRGTDAAVPLLLTWGAAADKRQRRSAWGAVAKLADASDLAQLVAEFLRLPSGAASEARRALTAASRCGPTEAVSRQLEEALASSPSETHRAVLLAVLGDLAIPDSYALLAEALTHRGVDVRAAAVRALSTWPDPRAVADLLNLAQSEDEARVRILALRSALSALRKHGARMSARGCTELLRKAEAAAERTEERIMVVQTARAVSCEASASIIVAALEAPELRDVAESALLSQASFAWLDAGVAVRNALARVVAEGKNDDRRAAAGELLKTLPTEALLARIDAIPWASVFNGRDLSGWRMVNGRPDSWSVRDGLLVARKGGGGWLARVDEQSDYAVEFEFRLPPGGNSGFFLRPPLAGNPAWEGIEVQILDDASPKYAKLRPDQYCAGIYGMAGAEPRVSRPSGEWQQMRILCVGRLVSVWLNGSHVARADLDQHMDKADKIRGLRRKSGFPGLQNEHGPIEFRNIRMKRLD